MASKRELTSEHKKATARYYYVYQGLNAKDTATKAMVTEKTIGKWINDYNWREERKSVYERHQFKQMYLDADANILLGNLKVFLSHYHKELYKEIDKSIDAFIRHNMENTNDHKEQQS